MIPSIIRTQDMSAARSAGENTPSAGAATPSLAGFIEHTRLYDIPPLEDDGANYIYWKHRTEIILKLWDLWGVVNGDIPMPDPSAGAPSDDERAKWSNKDLDARAQITLTIKNDPLNSILDATTAKECWDKLSAWYQAKWEPQVFTLLRKVTKSEFSDGEPLGPQIDDLLQAARMLESIGRRFDDNLLVYCIICALPPSRSALRNAIITIADESGISSERVRWIVVHDEHLRGAKAAKKGKGDS